MPYITRIHLADCGWREAYFPGTTIALTDPRTGKPAHTVFSLENTGGKTSFLALVLSCFDTNERRFLKTLIHRHQRFEDYFGDSPAFIAVEWDLADHQASLFAEQHLVTGQIVVPRGDGGQRHYERHFFTFRTAPELTFDSLPAPGLNDREDCPDLSGHQDVQRWLHDMRTRFPGNFQSFTNQADWKRKLAEERIDTVLLAAQVEFNRSEGGIEDFLDFRSEAEFIRKFLAITIPDAQADRVRDVLDTHVSRLSDRPRLMRREAVMRTLQEKFAPFVEVAGTLDAAHASHAAKLGRAGALRRALAERRDQVEAAAGRHAVEADNHDAAAAAAADTCRKARFEEASIRTERLRRAAGERRRHAEQCRTALQDAEKNLRRHEAARLLDTIETARAESLSLQTGIDEANSDLQPRRDRLTRMGADLRATLLQAAVEHRNRLARQTAEAQDMETTAAAAEATRLAQERLAQEERQQGARLADRLARTQTIRDDLETRRILEADEPADAAAGRHRQAACEAGARAGDHRDQALAIEGEIRETRDEIDRLADARSDLLGECGQHRMTAETGDGERRRLGSHPDIIRLTGENDVDPDSDVLERMLADAVRSTGSNLRQAERDLEDLQAERDLLETFGLGGIDADVAAIVERLRQSGIPDAQPYASWLSQILASPDDVRRFAETDPARFTGVAVPNDRTLAQAGKALDGHAAPSRPITVAVGRETPGDADDGLFVVPVEQDFAYSRESADLRKDAIDALLQTGAETADARRTRLDAEQALHQELVAWRTRFGHKQLDKLWSKINDLNTEVEEIATRITGLRDGIATREEAAEQRRLQASAEQDAAVRHRELADRADEHHRLHESHAADWRSTRDACEERAAAAMARAQAAASERDRRKAAAQTAAATADKLGHDAAQLERDADALIYAAGDGAAAADLPALRHEYCRALRELQSLESGRIDHLRGQKDAIDRRLSSDEDEFESRFSGLDREEVRAVAARGGLAQALDAARTADAAARQAASDARSDAESAETIHLTERTRVMQAFADTPPADLENVGTDDLDSRLQEALSQISIGEESEKREQALAAQARREAERLKGVAGTCGSLLGMLTAPATPERAGPEPFALPPDDEIEALASQIQNDLYAAQTEVEAASDAVRDRYQVIRNFATSDAFDDLDGEKEVAAYLATNNPLDAAAGAPRTAALIADRLATIEHDLSRLDEDLQTCVLELDSLLGTARHILNRMARNSTIPSHVPRFGGHTVFRVAADLGRVSAAQRKTVLEHYVTALAESERLPETGQNIASELIDAMCKALGRSSLGIRLLKPKGEGDIEYMPVDQASVSGGEALTAAMMIYLVLAKLRAEAVHGARSDAGILILDNPLGKANKTLLVKTQIGLAEAMGIQLFYTTGIQDTNALGEFENIVRLRRTRQSRSTGRIHLAVVEAMRTYIDKPDGVEAGTRNEPVSV